MKILKSSIILILLFCFATAYSQVVIVLSVKDVKDSEGNLVKRYDKLGIDEKITVESGGRIVLQAPEGEIRTLDIRGTYKIKKLFDEPVGKFGEPFDERRVFSGNLGEFKKEIEEAGIKDCTIKTTKTQRTHTGAVHRGRPINEIQSEDPINTTASGQVKLTWEPRENYRGNYYVFVTDMFENPVDFLKTKNAKLSINVSDYQAFVLLYIIVSEDCFVSTNRAIKINR